MGNILSLCYSVDFVIGHASSLLLLGECLLRLLLYDIDQYFEQLCPLVERDHIIALNGTLPSVPILDAITFLVDVGNQFRVR